MYNGTETVEYVNAHQQELTRQIDRVAREVEVQWLLTPAKPDHGADLDAPRFTGLVATIAGWLYPRRRMERPSG